MASGARNKFDTPMFEPDVFRKQMYCIEESTWEIVRTFRCPRSDSASGEFCPPLLRPCSGESLRMPCLADGRTF